MSRPGHLGILSKFSNIKGQAAIVGQSRRLNAVGVPSVMKILNNTATTVFS